MKGFLFIGANHPTKSRQQAFTDKGINAIFVLFIVYFDIKYRLAIMSRPRLSPAELQRRERVQLHVVVERRAGAERAAAPLAARAVRVREPARAPARRAPGARLRAGARAARHPPAAGPGG